MSPIKRNCIQTFQLRSNYMGIPFVVALIGALFVVIAYALNKHHAWNAFSKHPVALGGSVVGVFVLSIIGSLLQRRYDQKQLLVYLSRNYVFSEDDQSSRCISLEAVKRIVHLSLSEAKKEFHQQHYCWSIYNFPALKAYIEKGVPADWPLAYSTTARCTLLGNILYFAGQEYYVDRDHTTRKDKNKEYLEAEGESVKEMVSFLLEHEASVNGLAPKEIGRVLLTTSYGYRKGVDMPLLTLSFMNYLPNKCEIIELMMKYHPDYENVQIDYLLAFLFLKELTTDLPFIGIPYRSPMSPLDWLASDKEYQNPSEEEIDQTMKLLEKLIAEGAPYMQNDGSSILLSLSERISASHYGPCKSRVLQAIVNGESIKQKKQLDQLRTTLLEKTKMCEDVIDLIAGYAIHLPKLVVSALAEKESEAVRE